jgi:hypothetical protein
MQAIRYHRYGSPDVLELTEVDQPAVGDGDVLIRVRAASVNPLDLHFLRGKPYVMRPMARLSRPRNQGLGADLALVENSIRPGQAACLYSCRTPPRRSRRWMRKWVTSLTSASGAGSGCSGRAFAMPWWGLWPL